MQLRSTTVALVVSLALAGAVRPAHAAAGALDTTFGKGGKVDSAFGTNAMPRDAVLQPDGKIVVAGTIDDFVIATRPFHVARYLSNGARDTAFGSRGSVKIAFTNFLNSAAAVTRQSDGKIVVVGDASTADGSSDEFAIARLNADGSLDASFGFGGKVMTDFFGPPPHPGGVREAADVVVVQPDGKLLVGGVASRSPRSTIYTALARYNTDGSLDQTFGSGGLVAVAAIGNVNALALTADNHILAANQTGAVAQFELNGTLDPAVTGGAPVVAGHTGVSMFDAAGRVLVARAERDPAGGRHDIDVHVLRFAATGGQDSTFNSPIFDFGPETGALNNVAQALALQPDGNIVVGGYSQPVGTQDLFGMARLASSGPLDAGFGSGGTLTTTFFGSDFVEAVLIQPDGRILAVGQTLNPTTGFADIVLARYLGQ